MQNALLTVGVGRFGSFGNWNA